MDLTPPLKGILFDKDGTLFDFNATWDAWAAGVLRDLAGGDDAVLTGMADAIAFDLETESFEDHSPVIAGTNAEVSAILARFVPRMSAFDIELYLSRSAAMAPLAPTVPLAPLLDGLRAAGLLLGVMTNDSEESAKAHMAAAGVADRFFMILGADSGFGGKPDPEPLLAFADQAGLAPETVAMVGDSTHDLRAGRAAGMRTIGVLTGPAGASVLAPYADAVLPDIGHLPAWLRVPVTG